MSNGIRGRPPGQGPTTIPQPQVEEKSSAKDAGATKNAAAAQTPEETNDKFVRGGPQGPQDPGTLNRLQQLMGGARTSGPKLQFTNEELRFLAAQFGQILKGSPNLSRSERAKAFAEAILKRKKLRAMFKNMKAKEMEEMCESIGNLLDSSPKFGQLVDDVSEEAGKMNS